MGNDIAYDQRDIRGTDSNSLLRMYDLANELFAKSTSQVDRARAEKAIRRISEELRKRKVPFQT